jgi:branched-subunit amino acid ABC-type transport system permease component
MFDSFLFESIINGLLLGGVLALLALGLNLIFGVIDVVWICYAELVMIGMYAIYWLYVFYGVPLPGAVVAAVLAVALLGVLLHRLVIEPVLGTAPINQLLVTGGVLFFLQAWHPHASGGIWRHVLQLRAHSGLHYSARRRVPVVAFFDAHLSWHRHPRHFPGSGDHAADGCGPAAHLPDHLGDWWWHGGHGRKPAGAAI